MTSETDVRALARESYDVGAKTMLDTLMDHFKKLQGLGLKEISLERLIQLLEETHKHLRK